MTRLGEGPLERTGLALTIVQTNEEAVEVSSIVYGRPKLRVRGAPPSTSGPPAAAAPCTVTAKVVATCRR
jgi:hypothetical protein